MCSHPTVKVFLGVANKLYFRDTKIVKKMLNFILKSLILPAVPTLDIE